MSSHECHTKGMCWNKSGTSTKCSTSPWRVNSNRPGAPGHPLPQGVRVPDHRYPHLAFLPGHPQLQLLLLWVQWLQGRPRQGHSRSQVRVSLASVYGNNVLLFFNHYAISLRKLERQSENSHILSQTSHIPFSNLCLNHKKITENIPSSLTYIL